MIKDLLTPEDHDDPYVWAAVLLAHGFICQIVVVVLMMFIQPVEAFVIISLSYLCFWETRQFIMYPSFRTALDGMIDWLAISCGTFAIVCVYMDELKKAAFVMFLLLVLAVIGYQRRA